jgi:hypothetical protein
MKKLILLPTLALALALAGCSGTDYLHDITTDTHSGCYSDQTNYMGFTHNVTYIHLGDHDAAVNASPACAGITATSSLPPVSGSGIIPGNPAPVGKTGQ